MSKLWIAAGLVVVSGCYEAEYRIDRGYRAASSYDVSSPYDCYRCGNVAVVPNDPEWFKRQRSATQSAHAVAPKKQRQK